MYWKFMSLAKQRGNNTDFPTNVFLRVFYQMFPLQYLFEIITLFATYCETSQCDVNNAFKFHEIIIAVYWRVPWGVIDKPALSDTLSWIISVNLGCASKQTRSVNYNTLFIATQKQKRSSPPYIFHPTTQLVRHAIKVSKYIPNHKPLLRTIVECRS